MSPSSSLTACRSTSSRPTAASSAFRGPPPSPVTGPALCPSRAEERSRTSADKSATESRSATYSRYDGSQLLIHHFGRPILLVFRHHSQDVVSDPSELFGTGDHPAASVDAGSCRHRARRDDWAPLPPSNTSSSGSEDGPTTRSGSCWSPRSRRQNEASRAAGSRSSRATDRPLFIGASGRTGETRDSVRARFGGNCSIFCSPHARCAARSRVEAARSRHDEVRFQRSAAGSSRPRRYPSKKRSKNRRDRATSRAAGRPAPPTPGTGRCRRGMAHAPNRRSRRGPRLIRNHMLLDVRIPWSCTMGASGSTDANRSQTSLSTRG